MMKHSIFHLSAFLILAVMTFGSCTSNSSTQDNGSTGTLDTRGADYLPIALNQVVSGHVRGVSKKYDINGSLTGMDSIDQDRTAFVMGSAMLLGLPGFSIAAYDDHGAITNRGGPTGFVAISNDNVYASDHDATDKALVLPAVLSDGLTWNPDSHGDPIYKVTMTSHLASFTNKNGNIYQNVIQLQGSLTDSTNHFYGSSTDIQVVNIGATIYLAKGVGFVEVDVDRYDFHDYSLDAGGIHGYERKVISGTVSLNK